MLIYFFPLKKQTLSLSFPDTKNSGSVLSINSLGTFRTAFKKRLDILLLAVLSVEGTDFFQIHYLKKNQQHN